MMWRTRDRRWSRLDAHGMIALKHAPLWRVSMSLLSKQAAALVLTAIASLLVMPAYAAQPKTGAAPAQKVSMLGGKFNFTLPKGFTATPLPAGDAAQGTAGTKGTMYSNATSKTVVITAENTIIEDWTSGV